MRIRNIVLILLAIALVFGVIKAPKIKRYFAEERYYSIFVMLGKAEACYNPHKNAQAMFNQEKIDYQLRNKEVVLTSLAKIIDKSAYSSELKIPSITHQIYFTANGSLNDFYIEKMKANFAKLNQLSDNWQHNLWSNKLDIFPEDLRQIKGVKLRDISELKNHEIYPILSEAIAKGSDLKAYFAESADLARIMILQQFGGIYNDMDYEIYNPAPLFEFMKRFNFIGAREQINSESYYANSFLATSSNHPILNEMVRRIYKNYNKQDLSDYIKYPCTENDRLYFNGPPLVTIAYLNKNNIEGNNDVILPPWMLLNISFARYKNKYCDYAKITKEDFQQNNQNLKELLAQYSQQFKQDDIENIYAIRNDLANKDEDNIYYNLKYRNEFEVIGADMGCGSWVSAKNPRHWYWND
jgi:mannosyltransferase OCH1-like enzyme